LAYAPNPREAIETMKQGVIALWSRKFAEFIFEFETGEKLDEINQKIIEGDKKSALLLAKTIVPQSGTPEYDSLEQIKGQAFKNEDYGFLSKIKKASDRAKTRKWSESLKRNTPLFFWTKLNEPWLVKADWREIEQKLFEEFGDESPEDIDNYLRYLRRIGITKGKVGRPKGAKDRKLRHIADIAKRRHQNR